MIVSINGGKSTISELLAQTVPERIKSEVDPLRHLAGCLSLEETSPYLWGI